MHLPSWPLCYFRYHRSQHLNHSSALKVWHPRLSFRLVPVISRSFSVRCDVILSSLYASSCGVPQGSIFGPLHFVMYTTPLSTLISPLSLNHHLYADDTQLFFSFHPPDFDSRTTHLQDSLQQISSWTTANLSTLNSSKTELLLIGFTKQHSKMQNSSLNTTHSARNLGFIFDEHLTFSDQISSVSKSCYYDMIWYDMTILMCA